jgi:hypothetical protein
MRSVGLRWGAHWQSGQISFRNLYETYIFIRLQRRRLLQCCRGRVHACMRFRLRRVRMVIRSMYAYGCILRR